MTWFLTTSTRRDWNFADFLDGAANFAVVSVALGRVRASRWAIPEVGNNPL